MRSLVCGCVMLVAGCYNPYYVRPGVLPPATAAVSPGQRDLLWQRAVAVLLDEGYVPQVLNEAACYVSGRRREDVDYDGLDGTMAIVTIGPDGLVRVAVSGGGRYQSANDLNGDVGKRQVHLLSRILGQGEPPAPPAGS